MTVAPDPRQKILAANAASAQSLRDRFTTDRTLVANLISSPGSGKTALLENTLGKLAAEMRVGVLDGDIATELDAERIARRGVRAHQILTGGSCHLDARQIEGALGGLEWGALDLLVIENVGNLICPTSYDLGEDFKVVLLSVTEGDDKPFKYPAIFARADVALITKVDLLPHVDFRMDAVLEQIRTLRPDGTILHTSTRTGEGLDAWCDLLRTRLAAKRAG